MTTPPETSNLARLNRIRFRAWRRGFREADLLLGGFANARLSALTESQLAEFENLLEDPDQDVWAWVTNQAQPPAHLSADLLEQLRRFRPHDPALAKPLEPDA